MLLARLRWSAFGLRGRIVGAVIVTTAISLGVAALVLLPQLESSLKNAAQKTLTKEVADAKVDLTSLAHIPYWLIPEACVAPPHSTLAQQANEASTELSRAIIDLGRRLGTSNVTLIGHVDGQGNGRVIVPGGCQSPQLTPGNEIGELSDIQQAYQHGQPHLTFGNVANQPVVRAAIPLNAYRHGSDAVLAVRKSIDEIQPSVQAVRRAFEIAALVAILLTMLLAIPLAGTLVSRLQRLRQAALQLAIGGSVAAFPADRARDEVGDLARSFAIMQRRLLQQEEARRAFVATASHELRTPLASLEGMLELLAEDFQAGDLDIDDASALLHRARAQSRRLSRLAADLLDLSRIDAEISLRSEPIELGELGRAVLAEFELASAGRGVRVKLTEDRAPAWALADPGSVARILRILLDNALRVAPRDTEIRVEVRSRPEPTLIVSDQGPGVAQEERALIFERFKRGSETGGEAGFGLGLAIGRELAQRMGGSLVLADTDGPGATFMLRLQPTEAPSTDPIASAAGV
ncbi:MAG: HAMP domain-containing histidine kinase [Conexibacteraceae bacterium]|nr:HAMP domain-containing histidine kinase [Conexibacteraceae bacterium]